ncbi:hypothetical protein [Halobacterium zhouii]|uniref:hypothetical protein n=1 Tax=Halobacterium zhouii TaxID=2902624 RepID=UPI001E3DCF57|nr:hypothetical protein [Halobacterium zhouii]
MNQTGTSTRAESESDAETGSGATGRGRRVVSTVTPYLWRGVRSGAATGIIGGAALLSGLRTLLAGQRKRGLVKLAFGGAFLAVALAQRRSREESVEETDVIDTEPDVGGEGSVDEASGAAEADHATGQAAPEVEEETESGEESQTEEIDRLGEAAVDGQSREVPVPQRAFNQGFLAHSTEAFWGISRRDGAVLVSQDFDAIQGRDGVEYVASSEIGEDVRELPIPTAVFKHWDEAGGGGTAVTGGDDVLFVTTNGLEADHLLRVLPSKWADDLTG